MAWVSGKTRSACHRGVVIVAGLLFAAAGTLAAPDVLVVGGEGSNCNEDPDCINRLHPEIPMAARAKPGQTILLKTRNATDFDLDPDSTYDDPREGDPQFGTVHPLTGPVYIEGAEPGDALAVTLLNIDPGRFGVSFITGNGFVADQVPGPLRVAWRLNRRDAVSEDLPGVRIPNGSFPGVVTVLPGPEQHAAMLAREAALQEAGGTVYLPHAMHATPSAVCGPDGSKKDECLRTIPPREHGGNMDIRHLGVGVTIHLPCFVEGCGLAVGDLHFAQGDGEVAGTAIEMDADVTLTTELIKGEGKGMRGPHYEGRSTLLDIPSRRFYATTGFPIKEKGTVPPDMEYLEAAKVSPLENLSNDLSLAARNAILEMIDHISRTYGLTRQQAYIVASVAVDLRIGQLVDAPNFGVTAVLPLDIFE
jgi:formamidase